MKERKRNTEGERENFRHDKERRHRERERWIGRGTKGETEK